MRTAVIVAAGRGTRAGGERPKQWQTIAGLSIARRSLTVFSESPQVDHIVLVVHPDDITLAKTHLPAPDIEIVAGGATRDASVLAGLEALADGATRQVLIHDVARPLLSDAVLGRVCRALETSVGAAPAVAVTDALWRGQDNAISDVVDRTGLYRAQTPQGFHFDAILAAHRAHKGGAADDVEVARAAGIEVAMVAGDEHNIKITLPEDFKRAEQILAAQHMDIRVGNGFDVHRFGAGDHVILCGVRLPHDRGLLGHSDADVGMHALTDAIYGALAQGDIGQHFPPSDPQWKGAASHIFLEHAINLAAEAGYVLSNADVTLICEYPKIGPHSAAMAAALANIMNVEPSRVSVKATTSEKLGFTGRKEGIAASATVALVAG